MAELALWDIPLELKEALWAHSGYVPTPEQLAVHADNSRIKQVVGGERAGKSRLTAEELYCWATYDPGLYWIVGPDYDLARPEFEHLVRALGVQIKDLSQPKAGSWELKTHLGSHVVTKTSTDPMSLAGRAPKGIAMVEAAQQTYEAFLRVRGRVAETRGPLILSGTLEGVAFVSWYHDLYRRWRADNPDDARSFSIPTWSNTAIFPGGRDDPEIKSLEATYPRDVFLERFGAEPSMPLSLVFREFSHPEHVQTCVLDKKEGVQLWIDPGYAGAYAVLAVQVRDEHVYVLDEVYERGQTAHQVIQECRSRPWWKYVKAGVIDIAARQHHGQESQLEIWAHLTGLRLHSQKVPIPDGILRLRTFLVDPETGKPRITFDPKCVNTIREFALYRYKDAKEGRPISETPISADNHAISALIYGLVSNFGFVRLRRERIRARISRN